MKFTHAGGYKFVSLNNLQALQARLWQQCSDSHLKGTILLSNEGININICGLENDISIFSTELKKDDHFADLPLRITYTKRPAYKRLKVKIKEEIVTFRRPEIDVTHNEAARVTPHELKTWLDEQRDVVLLDTRNAYEIQFGTFTGAINLHLKNFCELPDAIKELPREKEIVMFCTGGIRCEKAALFLTQNGFDNVYQLDGGILNYFEKVGADHYQGNCYVFDERISVNPNLEESEYTQCKHCQNPIKNDAMICSFCTV